MAFSVSVAKRNQPHTSTPPIGKVCWKSQVKMPSKMGVADRYHLLPGSAFETEFGGEYDLVLVTNFLHHFDPPTCTRFMKKVHAALKPGGRAAIAELVPNDDRISPPTAAAFSVMMLATTPKGGCLYFWSTREHFKRRRLHTLCSRASGDRPRSARNCISLILSVEQDMQETSLLLENRHSRACPQG